MSEFGPATLAVYASEIGPLAMAHLYGRVEPRRAGAVRRCRNQPGFPSPGWELPAGESGYWQYDKQKLDTIGKKLYRGKLPAKTTATPSISRWRNWHSMSPYRVWLVTALQRARCAAMWSMTHSICVIDFCNLFALRSTNIPAYDMRWQSLV